MIKTSNIKTGVDFSNKHADLYPTRKFVFLTAVRIEPTMTGDGWYVIQPIKMLNLKWGSWHWVYHIKQFFTAWNLASGPCARELGSSCDQPHIFLQVDQCLQLKAVCCKGPNPLKQNPQIHAPETTINQLRPNLPSKSHRYILICESYTRTL